MAQETETRHGLDAIAGVAREASRKGPPPVHLWNPPFCGDLDMRIRVDPKDVKVVKGIGITPHASGTCPRR